MLARTFPRAAARVTSLFLLAAGAGAQDQVALGFAPAGDQLLPAPFAAYDTLSNGDRVVFDGLSIDLYDPANNLLLHLGDVPAFVFASFVQANPTESFALVGESQNGDVFKVALDGTGMAAIANLPFNFDCAFQDGDCAWISAATCGFGCGNEIVELNTTTGATTFVIHVPGPSGPLDFHPDGRLFYVTQSDSFPPPTGSLEVVSWTSSQLGAGGPLDVLDATVFHAGLDGGSAIAVDPVFGNVFVAEAVFGVSTEVLELDGNGALVATVVTSADYLGPLEFSDLPGPGHFHAFQPADGMVLHYGNGNEVKTVSPARPLAQVIVNGPAVEFRVTGAQPDAAFLFTWGASSLWSPNETEYGVFGSFLYLSGLPLSAVRRIPWLTPTDSNGQGSYSFFDPGNLAGTLVLQGLLTDATGLAYIGTTTPALY